MGAALAYYTMFSIAPLLLIVIAVAGLVFGEQAARGDIVDQLRMLRVRRVRLHWRDVWIGAAVTALLFTIGKSLIGTYLGSSGITSGFGAAGSPVAMVAWVYYSAQVFLLGVEFTHL